MVSFIDSSELQWPVFCQQRPQDAGILGRNRHTGAVIGAPLSYRKSPASDSVMAARCRLLYRAGTHDEQGA
jgi:hypothetical protein